MEYSLEKGATSSRECLTRSSTTERPRRTRLPVQRLEYSNSHFSNRAKSISNESRSTPFLLSESDTSSSSDEKNCRYQNKEKFMRKQLYFNLTFDCVKGLTEQINRLKEMIIFPLFYPDFFKTFGVTPQRGILLHGPPGTGKTLLPKVIASELSKNGVKVNFFSRKGADCLSKWAGDSEKQLRLLFQDAFDMRPSIIFFDEIDGLAPIRSKRQDQIYCSVVSTLLALMDGVDDNEQVVIIGATNRIDAIDPAFRRPGRFDKELKFELPSHTTRKEIINMHSQKWNPQLSDDILNWLADKTVGYSGADLKALCGDTALHALKRTYPGVYRSSEKQSLDYNQIHVVENDFSIVMKSMIPSTHRMQEQLRNPLPLYIKPLLSSHLENICKSLDENFPSNSFRPRLLICADGEGFGQTLYLAPAILHHFENLPILRMDIAYLFSNSIISSEEALINLLNDTKRNLPGVLYIPHISKFWKILNDSLRAIFMSMIADIHPKAPLLILATTDEPYISQSEEIQQLFSSNRKEIYTIVSPNEEARELFFSSIFSITSNFKISPLNRNRSRGINKILKDLVHRTTGFSIYEFERIHNEFTKILHSHELSDFKPQLSKDLEILLKSFTKDQNNL